MIHRFDARHRGFENQLDAVPPQRLLDEGGGARFLARQDARQHIQQRHLRAEPGKCLGHLAADRTGPDDRETLRQFGQREQVLVGQQVFLRQARDVGMQRPGSGRDDRLAKPQRLPGDFDDVRFGESALAEEDVDPQAAKPSRRIVRADLGPHRANPPHRLGEVDANAVDMDAEAFPVFGLSDGPRRAQQRLRRNAAGVETIAAQEFAFDESHLRPESRGPRRRDQAGRPAADHDEIVPLPGRRIDPVGGTDLGEQRVVVRIAGKELDGHTIILMRLAGNCEAGMTSAGFGRGATS